MINNETLCTFCFFLVCDLAYQLRLSKKCQMTDDLCVINRLNSMSVICSVMCSVCIVGTEEMTNINQLFTLFTSHLKRQYTAATCRKSSPSF